MKSRPEQRSACSPAIAAKRSVDRIRQESAVPKRRMPLRFRAEAAIPRLAALLATVMTLATTTGCQVSPESQAGNRPAASAPYMTQDEFATVLAGGSGVTLVEFCVPTGCARCDEMRQSIDGLAIDGLASDQREPISVRRMNLREYPALAWEFDITVCPSYVAFRDGEEVYRAAHPTSADLIVSGLEQALPPSDDQLSLAVQ